MKTEGGDSYGIRDENDGFSPVAHSCGSGILVPSVSSVLSQCHLAPVEVNTDDDRLIQITW